MTIVPPHTTTNSRRRRKAMASLTSPRPGLRLTLFCAPHQWMHQRQRWRTIIHGPWWCEYSYSWCSCWRGQDGGAMEYCLQIPALPVSHVHGGSFSSRQRITVAEAPAP